MIRTRIVLSLAAVTAFAVACRRAGDSDPMPAELARIVRVRREGNDAQEAVGIRGAARPSCGQDLYVDARQDGGRERRIRQRAALAPTSYPATIFCMSDRSGGKTSKDVHNLLIKADSLIAGRRLDRRAVPEGGGRSERRVRQEGRRLARLALRGKGRVDLQNEISSGSRAAAPRSSRRSRDGADRRAGARGARRLADRREAFTSSCRAAPRAKRRR